MSRNLIYVTFVNDFVISMCKIILTNSITSTGCNWERLVLALI
jgi:hypothetical protein